MLPRLIWILAIASVPALADTAAVLPFWNASTVNAPDASNAAASIDWIGESIAETVRDGLGSRGVLALERNEVADAFHRLGLRERVPLTEGTVVKIGEELDVEQIVFGTFEFTPDPLPRATDSAKPPGAHGSLKISARILDLKRMRMGPAFVESGAIEDLATLQAHLAWRTLSLIAPGVAPPESEFRTVRAAVRLDAEENYVRGLLAHDPQAKEKFFTQAARLDARFDHPCYELGQIHYRRKEYRQAVDWLVKVQPESLHYREAQFLLGLALYQSGDFDGAQKAFQTILLTVPLTGVINDLAATESRRNLPQAADDFRKAVAADPNDADYRFNLGYVLWRKGDFAGAAENFRAILTAHPGDQTAALLLERCARKQGPLPSDARLTGIERLKTDYEERAYWQLKTMLEQKDR